jgi:hypothetical protein
VQAVGQLDQDDPDVAGHGQQHLAEALGLLLLLGGELDAVQLGQAVDEVGHLRAEFFEQLLLGDAGVFHDVVQQRRHQGFGVELPAGADLGDRDRVRDVGLAAGAELPEVGIVADPVGFADAAQVVRRTR